MSIVMRRDTILGNIAALAAFALLMQLFACAKQQPAPAEIPPLREQPRLSIPQLEKRIHVLINRERSKFRLAALEWNERLSSIARKHSADMAKRSYFSHYSPEGHDFLYRYQQAGFSCSTREGDRIFLGAENIFQNNRYDRIVYVNSVPHYDWNSLEHIAETTVQGWMNSPGHRHNILTPQWKSEGIGVVVAPDNKIYITQNFC